MEYLEYLIIAAWCYPLFTMCSMIYGYLRAKFMFKTTTLTKKIIIQITTVDNFITVNKIISTIRGYGLGVPYEIWVVIEPQKNGLNYNKLRYPEADKVVVVPREFKSISKFKARALDYVATLRNQMGMTGDDIKILYVDDDSLPSKSYIEKCFWGDYDIMEGITQPRMNYGTRYSYVENMRTVSCMSVCSLFQAHGHPVWVHGEGICVRASAEEKIQWKFDVISSEDLCFGHTAATKKLKWGFIWEHIYITSPWTFKDLLRQRNRWFWGHVRATKHILTWQSNVRVIGYHILGPLVFAFATLGMVLDLVLRAVEFDPIIRLLFFSSLAMWLGIYGYAGFSVERKAKHLLASIALVYYSTIMNVIPSITSLIMGRPKTFVVIRKERMESQTSVAK